LGKLHARASTLAARRYEGYYVVAIDTTPFWRPKLQGLLSKYYNSVAEKALPAVILGLVARIGEVAGKRIALPRLMLRVHPQDASETALKAALLKRVRRLLTPLEIMLVDAGFKLQAIQEAAIERYLVRLAKNVTARRNYLAFAPGKRGVKPSYGPRVRPLARTHKQKELAAATPSGSNNIGGPNGARGISAGAVAISGSVTGACLSDNTRRSGLEPTGKGISCTLSASGSISGKVISVNPITCPMAFNQPVNLGLPSLVNPITPLTNTICSARVMAT
jgi:hypothetical protein